LHVRFKFGNIQECLALDCVKIWKLVFIILQVSFELIKAALELIKAILEPIEAVLEPIHTLNNWKKKQALSLQTNLSVLDCTFV
jgi:multisubunit Na+/H+ antiporter MnhE subunit